MLNSKNTFLLIVRSDSTPSSSSRQPATLSMSHAATKYEADPHLISRLHALPIADSDLKPPVGQLEKSAVTYVVFAVTDGKATSSKKGCTRRCSSMRRVSELRRDDNQSSSGGNNKWVEAKPEPVIVPAASKCDDYENRKEESTNSDDDDDDDDDDCFCDQPIAAYASFAYYNPPTPLTPITDAYLVSVTVALPARRQGLCSALLPVCFRDLCSEEVMPTLARVKLHVRSDVPSLCAMYRALGFEVRRHFRNYYPAEKVDADEMVLVVERARRRGR